MTRNRLYILTLLTACLLATSCAEDSADPAVASEKFTAIFDDSRFDATYVPIDIRQTPDEGYLVLSARASESSNYSGIHLLKADKFGNFVKEIVVNDSLVNPLSSLSFANDMFVFVAMNTAARARIITVDPGLESLAVKPVQGVTYPSAASYIERDQNFVLLGYNSEEKQSVITVVDLDGDLKKPLKGFSTGLGGGEIIIDQIMIDHHFHNGKHFPFAVGQTSSGLYYFNGFYDYNFSLVFTNLTDDEPVGLVNGQNDDGGFSALSPLEGSTFAIARFHFGDNFLLPKATLTLSGSSSGSDINDHPLPELVPNAKVNILRATINAKKTVIFGSDTRSKQIGLYFYDENTNEFLSSRYLGFSNPYEFASITPTIDGGFAVCGTTYLAGRFPRICIFKLSEEEILTNVP